MKFTLLIIYSLFLTLASADEKPEVIMIHGFMGDPAFHTERFSPVTKEFVKAGFNVHIAKTPKLHTLNDHANLVIQQILDEIPAGKEIILVGHSQGGLVSRLVAKRLSELRPEILEGRKLKSVQTIGTPHRGYFNRQIRTADRAQRAVVNAARPISPRLIHKFFHVGTEMSPTEIAEFNKFVPDVDGVFYASITNKVGSLSPLRFVRGKHTDGLIPNKSSEWGTVITIDGQTPKGNHLDQVYSITGKYKAATLNGLALVNYTKKMIKGKVPEKGGKFDFKVPSKVEYISFKGMQILNALRCLLESAVKPPKPPAATP